MLKENNNLNDDELLESICCDIRYQYALHTTHLNEQPISDRTLSRFRERLYHYELETGKNLLEEEMSQLADVYSNYMNLNSNIKRMDSLMIASRCKRMSPLEIIYSTTAKAMMQQHEIMITDSAYSGKDNQKLAESKHTELITTALTGKITAPIFANFTFSEDGKQVISCPMGNTPDKTTYYPKTGVCRALFKKEYCEKCLHREECKGKPQKKNYAVHVSANMVERAKYLEKLSTDEYIQLTRRRNAVEGVPSVLRRRYHVDDIPVLGYLRSRQFFYFKIGAYNFNKLLRHNKRQRVESDKNLAIA